MSEKIELKIHKELHRLYSNMFHRIRNTAMNCAEYKKDKPEEVMEQINYIANPAKWDYCGILRKEDKEVLEMLEYLLDDDAKEVRRYKFWEPKKM